MSTTTAPYGMTETIPLPYEQAVERTRDALAAEGFGVLTEIDVDFRPYVILGACNPPLAYRALTEERNLGLLLPCNVIVYASDAPGTSVVAAMDPVAALELTQNDAVQPIALEVRDKLERVLADVEASTHQTHP